MWWSNTGVYYMFERFQEMEFQMDSSSRRDAILVVEARDKLVYRAWHLLVGAQLHGPGVHVHLDVCGRVPALLYKPS